ncbi:MAG: hypothetical protein JST48_03200 [Bacteroidetes bacterium]|nr:hypothetical protein [Bacteroidota bacterium]
MKAYMPISQEMYFSYTLPAIFFLFLGVFLFQKEVNIKEYIHKISAKDAQKLGYVLLLISLFFDGLSFIGIPAIGSVASFTGQLKYLAAFCFLFSGSLFSYFLIGLIYIELAVLVLRTGVFVSFFIWSLYLVVFFGLKYSVSFWIRFLSFFLFIPVIITIQGVKEDYRKRVWSGKEEGSIGLISDLAEKHKPKDDEPFSRSKGIVRTIGRLCEGWHLGLTLKQVPKKVPISQGKEMLADIGSSVIPRLIVADKKSVNSQEKFFKYTGHKLRGKTSMSIGVLGDFYINFGRYGSYIGLFIFGAFISFFVRWFTVKYVIPDPINIIWIPFILSYLIRANNDFYIFLNALVKGFIIFLAIDYARYNFLGERKKKLDTQFPVPS